MEDKRPAFRTFEGTTFERILQSFNVKAPCRLKPHEEEIKKRWESAFTMLSNTKLIQDREDVASKLMEVFGVERSTAYEDIKNSINLFGDVHKARKEGLKYILERYAMNGLKMANDEKDLVMYDKFLERLCKIWAIDKDEFHQPEWDLVMNQVNINITANPEDIGIKPIDNINELIEKYKIRKRNTIQLDDPENGG